MDMSLLKTMEPGEFCSVAFTEQRVACIAVARALSDLLLEYCLVDWYKQLFGVYCQLFDASFHRSHWTEDS